MTVLKYGASGSEVRELQTNLNKVGCSLSIDGKYGPATSRAVSDFQQENGLTVDGVAGPATQAKIAAVIHERIGEAVMDCMAAMAGTAEYKTLMALL